MSGGYQEGMRLRAQKVKRNWRRVRIAGGIIFSLISASAVMAAAMAQTSHKPHQPVTKAAPRGMPNP